MISSIVVLNYNDWETTVKYIKNIKSFDQYDYIVIVDNCSTNDSVKELKKLTDNHVILIENSLNNGYAAGNNVGAKYSIEQLKSDIVFISNPDIKCNNSDIKI